MCVMFISFFPKTVCLKKFALCMYVPFGEYKEKLNFWKLMYSVCLVGSNYYGGISLVAFFFFLIECCFKKQKVNLKCVFELNLDITPEYCDFSVTIHLIYSVVKLYFMYSFHFVLFLIPQFASILVVLVDM